MAAPRILVTRALHQASALADGLRAAGMEPILVPTIEIAPPSDGKALPRALAALDTFHWLLFTSANAVEAFAKTYFPAPGSSLETERNATAVQLPPGLRIAVIGPATARALAAVGLRVDLLPQHAVAESFAEALLPRVRQPDGASTRFLLVRAEDARDHLPEALRSAGAEVVIAPAHRTVVPRGSADALRALFADTETPDAVTFTSSSTVTNLLDLLHREGLTLPRHVLRASIGPVTTQTLREAGLPPQIQAAEATVEALVAAVRAALLPGN